MPTVYLSTEHSDAELALAARVADALECTALFVTWSPRGYEGPDCEAVLVAAPAVTEPAPAPTPPPEPTRLSSVLGRVAAFVAAIFRAPDDVESLRRRDRS